MTAGGIPLPRGYERTGSWLVNPQNRPMVLPVGGKVKEWDAVRASRPALDYFEANASAFAFASWGITA